MVRSRVALVRCNTYEEPEVTAAIRRGIDLLGGMAGLVEPNEKIVLKPNVLVGEAPEKHVGPHPLVFRAVAELAKEVTANVTYGDSPSVGRAEGQLRKTGYVRCAQELGIPLADFDHGREVQLKGSPFIRSFTLANGVLEADGLISIAKFKTHGLTRLTGAVKNQFGCVPGFLKPQYHVQLPDPLDLARMFVCLNLLIRPRLCVLDGIVAMEGNGPRNGELVNMGMLLFSRDPVALDAVMCRLVDLDPEYVPTMAPGREWGLGTYRPEEIELVGDALEPSINRAFKVVRAPVRPPTYSFILPALRNVVSPRPKVDAARCNRCGTCVRICPATPKAVDWPDGDGARIPVHRYERCIRCFCCQEVCPERAISIETTALGRMLRWH